MTYEEAVDRCGRALTRREGQTVENWRNFPDRIKRVEEIVTCLEELGVLDLMSGDLRDIRRR